MYGAFIFVSSLCAVLGSGVIPYLYYQGARGELFGPYPHDQVYSWYQKGHLPPHTPITLDPRHEKYLPIELYFNKATTMKYSTLENSIRGMDLNRQGNYESVNYLRHSETRNSYENHREDRSHLNYRNYGVDNKNKASWSSRIEAIRKVAKDIQYKIRKVDIVEKIKDSANYLRYPRANMRFHKTLSNQYNIDDPFIAQSPQAPFLEKPINEVQEHFVSQKSVSQIQEDKPNVSFAPYDEQEAPSNTTEVNNELNLEKTQEVEEVTIDQPLADISIKSVETSQVPLKYRLSSLPRDDISAWKELIESSPSYWASKPLDTSAMNHINRSLLKTAISFNAAIKYVIPRDIVDLITTILPNTFYHAPLELLLLSVGYVALAAVQLRLWIALLFFVMSVISPKQIITSHDTASLDLSIVSMSWLGNVFGRLIRSLPLPFRERITSLIKNPLTTQGLPVFILPTDLLRIFTGVIISTTIKSAVIAPLKSRCLIKNSATHRLSELFPLLSVIRNLALSFLALNILYSKTSLVSEPLITVIAIVWLCVASLPSHEQTNRFFTESIKSRLLDLQYLVTIESSEEAVMRWDIKDFVRREIKILQTSIKHEMEDEKFDFCSVGFGSRCLQVLLITTATLLLVHKSGTYLEARTVFKDIKIVPSTSIGASFLPSTLVGKFLELLAIHRIAAAPSALGENIALLGALCAPYLLWSNSMRQIDEISRLRADVCFSRRSEAINTVDHIIATSNMSRVSTPNASHGIESSPEKGLGIIMRRLTLRRNLSADPSCQDMNIHFRAGEVTAIIVEDSSNAAEDLFDALYCSEDIITSPSEAEMGEVESSGILAHGCKLSAWNPTSWRRRVIYLKEHEPRLALYAGALAGWYPGLSDEGFERHLQAASLTGAREILSSLPCGPGTILSSDMLTTNQWRCLALTRALTFSNKDVLLLSFPVDFLPPHKRIAIVNFLKAHAQKYSSVVIFSTRSAELGALADKAVTIVEGRINSIVQSTVTNKPSDILKNKDSQQGFQN